MSMNLLTRAIAVTLLAAAGLAGQDIAGKWVGVASTTDEGGTKREEKQTLEIRSENGKLTGLLVSRSGTGGTPFQVQQDGAKFNFYGFLDFEGGEHLRWKFELKNGSLVGTFSALHDSPKKWVYDRIGAMTASKAN